MAYFYIFVDSVIILLLSAALCVKWMTPKCKEFQRLSKTTVQTVSLVHGFSASPLCSVLTS